MNATDVTFQQMDSGNIISQYIAPLFSSLSDSSLHIIERAAWWIHILGILVFLNYLYYSKHLHILLAFPNTYYGSVEPKGKMDNLESVTNQRRLRCDASVAPHFCDVTPLHVAVHYGLVLTVRELLAAGADVNAQDNEGNTAMHAAAEIGRLECIKLLLFAGASKDVVN